MSKIAKSSNRSLGLLHRIRIYGKCSLSYQKLYTGERHAIAELEYWQDTFYSYIQQKNIDRSYVDFSIYDGSQIVQNREI